MKSVNVLIVSFAVLMLAQAAGATGIPAGSWKLSKAYCTNDSYVPTPDEQAFMDAIESGFTVDTLHVQTDGDGIFETRFNYDHASCVSEAALHLSYPTDGQVILSFGPAEWKTESSSDDVTINCRGSDRAEERYHYEVQDQALLLSWPDNGECGSYVFFYSLQSTHK